MRRFQIVCRYSALCHDKIAAGIESFVSFDSERLNRPKTDGHLNFKRHFELKIPTRTESEVCLGKVPLFHLSLENFYVSHTSENILKNISRIHVCENLFISNILKSPGGTP